MKSPMVQNAAYIPGDDKYGYSDMMVLESAAGFYVGTIYTDPDGFKEPGSRDSGYFPTYELAERELESIEAGETPTRENPSN